MYRNKRSKKKKLELNRRVALLLSLILIFSVAVVGTVAYLIADTEPVTNTFVLSTITTSVEETFENNVKSNVKIKNTGDTDAYIRAKVIITWKDADGNVYGQLPVSNLENSEAYDYTISYNLENGWVLSSDGFYYWTQPVKSVVEAQDDCTTGVLITSCKQIAEKVVGNTTYYLNVEIIGSGIQCVPTSVVTDVWSSGVSGVDGTTLQIKEGGVS